MFPFGSILCPPPDGGGRTCSPASAPFPALDDSHSPFPLCLRWCYLLKCVVHESTRIINMQVGAHLIQIQPGKQHPISQVNQTLTAPDPPGCPPGPAHRLTLPVLEPDTCGLWTLPHSALRHPRGRTQWSLTRPRPSQTLLLGDTQGWDRMVRGTPSALVDSAKPFYTLVDLFACFWPCTSPHPPRTGGWKEGPCLGSAGTRAPHLLVENPKGNKGSQGRTTRQSRGGGGAGTAALNPGVSAP